MFSVDVFLFVSPRIYPVPPFPRQQIVGVISTNLAAYVAFPALLLLTFLQQSLTHAYDGTEPQEGTSHGRGRVEEGVASAGESGSISMSFDGNGSSSGSSSYSSSLGLLRWQLCECIFSSLFSLVLITPFPPLRQVFRSDAFARPGNEIHASARKVISQPLTPPLITLVTSQLTLLTFMLYAKGRCVAFAATQMEWEKSGKGGKLHQITRTR